MIDERIRHEISHGQSLKKLGGGKLWYWETFAGQERRKRRSQMLISHIEPPMEVLEIGCGPGYFTQVIASTSANITAIDISSDLLEFAKEKVK